jgi:hypothetical protein
VSENQGTKDMQTQTKMSLTLHKIKPLITRRDLPAIEALVQQLGLDYLISDAFIDFCRIKRETGAVIFLTTLAIHNAAETERANLILECYQSILNGKLSESVSALSRSSVIRQTVAAILEGSRLNVILPSASNREECINEWIFAIELLLDHGSDSNALMLFEELSNVIPNRDDFRVSVNPLRARISKIDSKFRDVASERDSLL